MKKLLLSFLLISGMTYGQSNIVRDLYHYIGTGHPTNVKAKFSGLATGCTYRDRATDSIFSWQSGQYWLYDPYVYASVTGLKGDKGDPGIQGPIGATGPQGPAGASGSGSLVVVDNLYYLYTTSNFSPTIVLAVDTITKFGVGLFVFWQNMHLPEVAGDVINRTNGVWIRVNGTRSGELFNTAWVGYQDKPYRSTVGAISTYPGSLTQAQINTMFGTGYDRTKDTYDFIALNYAGSVRGKQYYSVTESPAGAIYQIDRTVKPVLNYETLPGHWVGDVSGDRRTVGSNFEFRGNYSTIMFNHSNGGTMVSDAYKDFNLIGGNANARTSNWYNTTFWGSNSTDKDTGLFIGCANNNIISNCGFNGLGMGLHIGFGMHSKVLYSEFSDIRNIGCQWDWQSIANGSPSASPCNGSFAYGNHIVGGVGGKYGFVSYESDGSHWDYTSGEGAGAGVSMISMFHIEGKSSTCKGGNVNGIRAEAHYQKAIVELDINESNWEVGTVWSQANNVMIDVIGNGSAITTFKDGKYPDGSALKFRLHSPFTNIKVDNSFNTWNASQVQYMTDLGGFLPNGDRQDIRSFRYQNWASTGSAAKQIAPESKTWTGRALYLITHFKAYKPNVQTN